MKNKNCNIENSIFNYDKEMNVRKSKLIMFKKCGAFIKNDFYKKCMSRDIHFKFDSKSKKDLDFLNVFVYISGRIIFKRSFGKIAFFIVQDISGMIQIYLSYNIFFDNYCEILKKLDIGDIIWAGGRLFKTKLGELTIFCKEIFLLTKSLRPLPDKYHGLEIKEKRYRKRYLDIIFNEKSKKTFIDRSNIIFAIRNFMVENGFIEVETPMMQPVAGGACAKPFVTYHESLNINLYLRVAPELYLKRLIVGGFEKIFEINKNFRNEGISSLHNPEFTMMEFYMAYSDYKYLMLFVEKLFSVVTKKIFGSSLIEFGNYTFDFSKKFNRMTMKESISKYCDLDNLFNLDDPAQLIALAKNLKIDLDLNLNIGKLEVKIFDLFVKKKLIFPTFITEYPIDVSPLSKKNDKNPLVADRFELFIAGFEVGNGFSELNDPEDQEKRFINQNKLFNNNVYDKDYIMALEYGMPPTAGFGIGIDRMIMLLTNNHSIRDVVLFPLLRPKD